jgi:hypothetical protein
MVSNFMIKFLLLSENNAQRKIVHLWAGGKKLTKILYTVPYVRYRLHKCNGPGSGAKKSQVARTPGAHYSEQQLWPTATRRPRAATARALPTIELDVKVYNVDLVSEKLYSYI